MRLVLITPSLILQCQLIVIHLLGLTGAEVVVVLPCVYVRNVIDFKIRPDLSDPDLEFLCIEIQKPRAKPFLISNWYRPPNSPIELFDKFEVLLAKIEAENVESNILADINCDMMAVTPANETRHLIELCELFQYTQLIKVKNT